MRQLRARGSSFRYEARPLERRRAGRHSLARWRDLRDAAPRRRGRRSRRTTRPRATSGSPSRTASPREPRRPSLRSGTRRGATGSPASSARSLETVSVQPPAVDGGSRARHRRPGAGRPRRCGGDGRDPLACLREQGPPDEQHETRHRCDTQGIRACARGVHSTCRPERRRARSVHPGTSDHT